MKYYLSPDQENNSTRNSLEFISRIKFYCIDFKKINHGKISIDETFSSYKIFLNQDIHFWQCIIIINRLPLALLSPFVADIGN